MSFEAGINLYIAIKCDGGQVYITGKKESKRYFGIISRLIYECIPQIT